MFQQKTEKYILVLFQLMTENLILKVFQQRTVKFILILFQQMTEFYFYDLLY